MVYHTSFQSFFISQDHFLCISIISLVLSASILLFFLYYLQTLSSFSLHLLLQRDSVDLELISLVLNDQESQFKDSDMMLEDPFSYVKEKIYKLILFSIANYLIMKHILHILDIMTTMYA